MSHWTFWDSFLCETPESVSKRWNAPIHELVARTGTRDEAQKGHRERRGKLGKAMESPKGTCATPNTYRKIETVTDSIKLRKASRADAPTRLASHHFWQPRSLSCTGQDLFRGRVAARISGQSLRPPTYLLGHGTWTLTLSPVDLPRSGSFYSFLVTQTRPHVGCKLAPNMWVVGCRGFCRHVGNHEVFM